jgi:hypothetical protein
MKVRMLIVVTLVAVCCVAVIDRSAPPNSLAADYRHASLGTVLGVDKHSEVITQLPQGMRLRVSPVRRTYRTGKRINIVVKAENLGHNETFRIGKYTQSLYYRYVVILTTESDKAVDIVRYAADPPVGYVPPPLQDILCQQYILLHPHTFYGFHLEVEADFKPGNYKLSVSYRDGLAKHFDSINSGNAQNVSQVSALSSNTIEIRVRR